MCSSWISGIAALTVPSNAPLGAHGTYPPGLLGLPRPLYCLPGPQYCLSWSSGRLLDAKWTPIARQLDAN